ncbi:restriction endonuclease subunit S [Weissella confusa]|uniref:restriction endonuclease subunit S n=2 Tax=Weissella confusa TaxID=1583 RepID=UPI0018F10C73|nr:restriction endonuclease subunit S [Weissella confusa]MBJ7664600.1 hypothetical protein [Weissella confusa]
MNKKPLSDLVTIISGGTPKRSNEEYWDGQIQWISVKDFHQGKHINHTEESITESGLMNSSTNLLEKDDIIISARGTVGLVSMIVTPMAFNQSIFGLRVRDELTPEYLYYWLKLNIPYIKNNVHGSVFDTITRDTFKIIEVSYPSLEEQEKATESLRLLDSKIEMNTQLNDNLSQLMMLVFEKFQDENTFDESTIGSVASLSKGLSYKSEFLDPDNTNPDSKFFISLSNFDITGGFKFGKMKYYFGPYKERHIVHPGDLLSGATDVTQDRKILGSPVIVPNLAPDMLYSLDVFKIDVDEQLRNWLYMQMQTPSYRGQIEGAATGTTVLRVPKDVIENFKIALPDERQLDEFNTLITPFIKMQELNFDEIRKLEDTRDTLLAKLIN